MPRPNPLNHMTVAQLESVLAKRRSRLAILEKERASLLRLLKGLDERIAAEGGSSKGSSPSGRFKNKVSLNDSIITVLKSTSGAMRVTDIVEAVEATGYRSSSDNFRAIVNQQLIKDPRFVKGDVRGTYKLKK
jgi:hypothetical protein